MGVLQECIPCSGLVLLHRKGGVSGVPRGRITALSVSVSTCSRCNAGGAATLWGRSLSGARWTDSVVLSLWSWPD
jgi:hypothetical protein